MTTSRYTLGQRIWPWIPFLSAGLLAWLPPTQACLRDRNPASRRLAVLLGLGGMLLITLMYVDDSLTASDSSPDAMSPAGAIGAFVAMGLIGFGVLTAYRLRPAVFAAPVLQLTQPAVAAALANRQLRNDARQLAARDPALARELRIGRPDLARDFDDGGLLDLNHIPLTLIADKLGWSTEDLQAFASARDKLGGFSRLDEIMALTGIDQRTIEEASERAVLIP